MECIWQLKISAMMLPHTESATKAPAKGDEWRVGRAEAPLSGSLQIFARKGTRWYFAADYHIVPVIQGRWGKMSCCRASNSGLKLSFSDELGSLKPNCNTNTYVNPKVTHLQGTNHFSLSMHSEFINY